MAEPRQAALIEQDGPSIQTELQRVVEQTPLAIQHPMDGDEVGSAAPPRADEYHQQRFRPPARRMKKPTLTARETV